MKNHLLPLLLHNLLEVLILWQELICNATLNDCGSPSLMVLLHPVFFLQFGVFLHVIFWIFSSLKYLRVRVYVIHCVMRREAGVTLFFLH